LLENIRNSFLHPEEEYTPIPFWFWNDRLTEQEIMRQIHDFHDKGVNGFVIHPRIGIPKDIEYLSDRFMELVRCAVIEANKLNMKVVLYDEAMYPSGSAHGMVVKKNPEYASKAITMIEYKCDGSFHMTLNEKETDNLISVQAVRKLSSNEISADSITKIEVTDNVIHFDVRDNEDWSVLVFKEIFTKGHIRGIHFGEDDWESERPASSDLLNLEAMEEFIRLTHDRYYEVLQEFFGNTIIGMFTDEPCIMGRGVSEELKPWTSNFLDYYIQHGNSELDLPFLWFEAGKLAVLKRKKYNETVNKRMEETYYKPIYNWCEQHQIALTGHPHESDDIGFLKYFHMPAQDVVWRWVAPENGLALEGRHSTMAKCSSDSARHRGKRRNGNECFACCGKDQIEWAFSADDMKWYMDWLFVRGVNLLYPHAFFYSIDGPRRSGERPPDVGPNNIWWPYYNQISDYIKRMSYLMTDSYNYAQVAVLCEANHLPWKMVKPLYENQIEFNYLENELLVSEDCKVEENNFKIGNQTYKLLLIEDTDLIDENNSTKIQEISKMGGRIIVYNPDKRELGIKNVINMSAFNEIPEILKTVMNRDVITLTDAKDLRVSHINKNNYEFYIFINEGENEIISPIRLKALGHIEKWNPWNGVIEDLGSIRKVDDNYIEIDLHISRRESVILFVDNMKLIKEKDNERTNENNKSMVLDILELDGEWQISPEYGNHKLGINKHRNHEFEKYNDIAIQSLSSLGLWNEMKGLENYSGSMFYKTTFNLERVNEIKSFILNLGEVYEIAQVFLNGADLGVQMWSPYSFNIDNLKIANTIKEGKNEIIIEVRNTIANQMCNLSLNSGLVGPVICKIERIKYE
jgi:hypothetical protein